MRHRWVHKAALTAIAVAITAGSVAAVAATSADSFINSARGHATKTHK